MEFATLFFYLFIMLIAVLSYQINWKRYNWIAIIVLTLVLGLRGCGIDTVPYIENFYLHLKTNAGLFNSNYYSPYYNPLYESDPRQEWFYLILIKIIKLFSKSSVWYFLIIDFLSFVFLDRFIQRFRKKEKMFIAFFFFTTLFFVQMFNAMRQCLAFMAFLNIVEFICRRNWKKYYLGNIILFAFHKSTLMLSPFYFFIHKDFLKSRSWQFVIYFTVAILSVVFIGQLKAMMDVLYLVLGGDDLLVKTSYLRSEEQELEMKSSILTIFFYSATIIYVIWHSVDFKKAYGRIGIIIYNFTFMGMLINNVAFNRGVERMNDYFDSFLFITLGLMAYQSLFGYFKKIPIMRLYTYGLFVLYLAWFANSVLQGAAGCAPYVLNPEL